MLWQLVQPTLALACGERIEVRMRAGVAAEALGVYFFGRSLGGVEDFGYVAAAGNVLAARAVAVLAGDAIRVAVHQGHLLV